MVDVNPSTRDIAHRSHVDEIALVYEGGLNRSADASGLNYFDSALDAGQSVLSVAQAVVASAEFTANTAGLDRSGVVDYIYHNVLNRAAEPAGLSYFANSAMTIPEILTAISQSTEAQSVQASGLHGYEAAVSGNMLAAGAPELSAYTPAPTIVTVPGPTEYVPYPVPGPTVVVDSPDVHVESFGTLNAALTNGAGNFYFGDGTTRANGNAIVQDTSEGRGLTLALAVQPRQAAGDGAGKFAPDNVMVDGNEAHATYHVPAGTQTTATGSFANVPNRGAFNVDLTVGTLTGTLAQHLAAGDRVELGIDSDASAATNMRYFDAFIDKGGLLQFNDRATGAPAITDNKGNDHVASNSEQINFFLPTGVAGLTPGAQYEVTLRDYAADGHLVAGVHTTLILGQSGTLDGTHLYA